jgi:hypothetical protein
MGGWLASRVVIAAIALTGGGVLGACGSSSHNTTSTSTSAAAAATSPASTAALPPNAPPALRAVAGRVLNAGDLPGFSPHGRRTVGLNVTTWIEEEHLPPPEGVREATRLQRLGFVTAVHEQLVPASGPAEAISIVVLFGSHQAARNNVAAEAQMAETRGASAFAVPGIPGARGFGGSSGGSSGYNVAFADGAYYYLVGAGYPTGTRHPPTRQQLMAAARRLYARVHR